MLRRLAMLFGLMLVGLMALAIYLGVADLGRFKDRLVPLASAALGRDVRVDGPLSLRLGQPVRIRADGLSMANAPWAGAAPMLEAESLHADVDLWSMVRGPLRVERVEVHGAMLRLEQSPGGLRNWSLPAIVDNGAAGATADVMPSTVPNVTVHGARIVVSAPALTQPTEIAIDTATVGVRDGMLVVETSASVNEAPLRISGKAGPSDQLSDLKNFDVRIDAALGDISLVGRAAVTDARELAFTAADIKLDGPDANYVFDLLHMPALTSGPLHLEATLAPGAQRSRFTASTSVGEFRAAAEGWFENAGGFDATWQVAGPDLADLGQFLSQGSLPAVPFEGDGSVRARADALALDDVTFRLGETTVQGSGRVVPDDGGGNAVSLQGRLGEIAVELSAATIEGLSPDGARLTFAIEGPRAAHAGDLIGLKGLPAEAFAAAGEGTHTNRVLDLDSAQIELGGQRLDLAGRLDLSAARPTADLTFNTTAFDLARHIDVPDRFRPVLGSIAGSGRVRAPGRQLVFTDLSLRAGDTTWTGNLDMQFGTDETGLVVDIEGPDAAAAARAIGVESFPAGPYRLSAGVALRGPLLLIDAARLTLGEQRVDLAGRLGFGAAQNDTELEIAGERVDLSPWVRASGDLASAVTSVTGKGRLRQSDKGLTIDGFSVRAGSAALEGSVSLAADGDTGAFDLQVAAPAASYLHGTLASYPLSDEPIDLRVTGAWRPKALEIGSATLRVGERGALSGKLRFETGDPPYFAADLTAGRLDLRAETDRRNGPHASSTDSRVIPASTLPLDWLAAMNGEVTLAIDEFYSAFSAGARLRMQGAVRDGRLLIDELQTDGKRGRIQASLNTLPIDGAHAIHLEMQGQGLYIAPPDETEAALASRPAYALTASLDATGSDFRQLASTLSGNLQIHTGAGTVRRQSGLLATLVMEDLLTRTLETINPLASDRDTMQLNCLVLRVDIADGKASGDPLFAMQTRELNLLARGSVDLGSEALDIDIAAQPRQGLGISLGDLINPFTRLGGTLASPAIVADPKTGVVETGAGIATGGLWPLAKKLQQRFLAGNPCTRALDQEHGAARQ